MESPQCVAVDAQDNFYVTDSETGRIFVFEAGGKFKRIIGNLKGGEGYFKRPTGIAVDSAAQRIYVTDTLRNKVYVLDMNGSVMQTIGQDRDGNLGSSIFRRSWFCMEQDLAVVDAMNFRVQVFDRSGELQVRGGRRLEMERTSGASSGRKESGSTAKGTCMWWTAPGAECRCSISRESCFITSGPEEGSRERSTCLRECLSTTTTASTWRIRTTAACKSFSITGNGSRAGASRNEVLVDICGSAGTGRQACRGNSAAMCWERIIWAPAGRDR